MILARYNREIRKLFKFFLVGGTTFIIQAGLYFIFSRWLLLGINKTAVYTLAVLYSLVFNYSVNRIWTFGEQGAAKGSAQRYIQVAIVATLLSTLLFWMGHAVFDLFDMWVLIGVNLIIPFFTFITHRIYTFHEQPGRIWQGFVRSGADSV